jgi:HTH-type transcriptional regulator / antitoxin HigA
MATTIGIRSKDRYLELVKAFPLRPIRNAKGHKRALATLRGLVGESGPAVADYKVVLGSLIEEYERDAFPELDRAMSKLTAADIVLHLLGERDMSVNAFAKAIGVSQSSLSDMINGRRDWSKTAIVRIADYFGLQPGLFLR